MPQIVFSTM